MAVPGRRFFSHGMRGYLRLLFAFIVVLIEFVTRAVFSLVPRPIVAALDSLREKMVLQGRRVFRSDTPLEDAAMDMSTMELVALHGYVGEEHYVKTRDGYMLTLHRIVGRRDGQAHDTGSATHRAKPPVLMVHGLLMCSEVWVVTPDALAFQLVDAGCDVWLANCRGNRYSTRHTSLKPQSAAFWDFSLDEMAHNDIPACIDHALSHTDHTRLAYVGFSQGTALAFACFSLTPALRHKISVFCALAPACKSTGFKEGSLRTFVRIAPDSVFLFFGRHSMWPSVYFWRNLLTRKTFASAIDTACSSLFGWQMNMYGSEARKQVHFAHLYSTTSVKVIVHWMQISSSGSFEMFDELYTSGSKYRSYVSQKYPIHQIRIPTHIYYGARDGLTDIPWLLNTLPSETTTVHCDPDYQHVEMIWGEKAPRTIFPQIVSTVVSSFESKSPHADIQSLE